MKIRLSHSSLETFHSCERKFQLEKIYHSDREEDSPHLVGGTAFGVACAEYLVTNDAEKAAVSLWLAYGKGPETDNRNQWVYLNAFWRMVPLLDKLLEEWEVVSFVDGKPAVELSFRVDIDDTFYYVGYMDVVLRNKFTGIYAVLDFKHTGLHLEDLTPMYKYSGQLIGYSIVLDRIVGENQASYEVHYMTAQLGRNPFEVKPHWFTFDKTMLDRLNWFITLKLDAQSIHQMIALNIFPRRGQSCLKFNKPCFHFSTCSLNSLEGLTLREDDHEKEYDFYYKLDDLIADHLERSKQL